MTHLKSTYRTSLALLTDLYELTMAYGYWKLGKAEQQAAFHLFFRRLPFGGGYGVAAGLATVIEYLDGLRFQDDDIQYLSTLEGNDGRRLFDDAFLRHLQSLQMCCDVDAVEEGTVVFPHEPLIRVVGPILQAQILETPLLNLLNYQTLIATKAARVCDAARGDPVLEFGLRRAPGVDGGLAASRAAYVGGCAATSNVLAGKRFGIPVRGTHAHSWVMSFDDEATALESYAQALPNNCVFLVDTYDTLQGVRRAIDVGRKLREQGHEMVGIRLDSGDLAYLSIHARQLLDEAGFAQAVIVASNDLDEHIIASLRQQGAPINVWGVGTKLVTGGKQGALGGVYKLTAVRNAQGIWIPRIKLSEQAGKVTTPGVLQVRRYRRDGNFVMDMIYDQHDGVPEEPVIVDPADPTRRRSVEPANHGDDLLVPIVRQGAVTYQAPPLEETRRRARTQLATFHEGVRRLVNPHEYPVGIEKGLNDRKLRLILESRGEPCDGP